MLSHSSDELLICVITVIEAKPLATMRSIKTVVEAQNAALKNATTDPIYRGGGRQLHTIPAS